MNTTQTPIFVRKIFYNFFSSSFFYIAFFMNFSNRLLFRKKKISANINIRFTLLLMEFFYISLYNIIIIIIGSHVCYQITNNFFFLVVWLYIRITTTIMMMITTTNLLITILKLTHTHTHTNERTNRMNCMNREYEFNNTTQQKNHTSIEN